MMTPPGTLPATPGVNFIKWLGKVPPFAAIAAMALGIAGLLGWFLRIQLLLYFIPGHSPIQFNGALALLCIGITLRWPRRAQVGQRAPVVGAAALVFLMGLATWLEYQFDMDLGIDLVFFKPYDIDGIASNGRMAPNAAVCFALLGLVGLVMQLPEKVWRQSLLLSLFVSVSFGVGALAFFGYVSGVAPAYSWGPVTRLALPLAIGIPLVSTGQLIQIWDLGSRANVERSPRVAFPVTLGLVIVAVGFARILEAELGFTSVTLPALIIGLVVSGVVGTLIYFAQALMGSHERMVTTYKTLAKQTIALERTNKELERFAYISAHDLQEPLRTIGSYTQVLQAKYVPQLDSQGKDYLKKITDGVRHLEELLTDVMTYTSLSKARLFRETVNFDDLMARLRSDYAKRFIESGAKLEASPLPELQGNSVLFRQVFAALVDNALKFRGDAPPVITISAVKSGSMWEYSVRDNGIGIDPKYHEQIFEMFKRLQGRHVHEGTGLGLAIVKKIVESYGGTIRVSSEPGAGATFVFTIPADPHETHHP